ncbi:hypothetical protein ANCCAN_06196 [Ancylostoma caninum]|uniref:Uncharacterized protein n=1 Tax=Ancylostoma caninum TaxID=29170 RepID=A0A368GTN8_ANCCA|nr:hypothetical protein ANCCAN_06196 [Ancylostoma caninum]
MDLPKEENKCHNLVMEGTSKNGVIAQVKEQQLPTRSARKKRFHRSHSTESNHSDTGRNMRKKRSKSVTEDGALNTTSRMLENLTEVEQLSNKPGNGFQDIARRLESHAGVNVASKRANITSEIPMITL